MLAGSSVIVSLSELLRNDGAGIQLVHVTRRLLPVPIMTDILHVSVGIVSRVACRIAVRRLRVSRSERA